MGEEEEGTGEERAGVGKFWGRVLYQSLLYFSDFILFLCTLMQSLFIRNILPY